MSHAPLAVTCGEPAGIGPEIAQKAWDTLRDTVPFVWLGNPDHLPLDLPWTTIESVADAPRISAGAMPVLPLPVAGRLTPGEPQAAQAQGVITALERSVDLALGGHVAGLCTAPIHKKALQDGAEFAYPGHTEFLAALAGVENVVMMLAGPELRVVPATIHIPLAGVPAALTRDGLTATLRITHDALRGMFGIENPRLAVAGLNPHAGEGGKIGREEIEIITPVLEALRAEGMDLAGPMSADTMFHAPARARYDAAVCMYHDQALIPIKTLCFDEGVNITLGLPFLRTSPDHGTAFDIAGQGIADATSMVAALRLAWTLAHGD